MSKDYKKALDLYNRGYLEKSIKYCNDIVAKDLKNSSVLNLKGLMLYLKGDLDEAISTWKVNYDYNKDQVSNAYLRDTKVDKEKISLYREAQNCLKELKVSEAIEILQECKKSDFNAIGVNNALAVCYYRKGEFDIAKVYITKSITIDKKNNETIAIMKKIDEVNGVKSNKKYVVSFFILVLLTSTSVMIFNNRDNIGKEEDKIIQSNPVDEKEDVNDKIKEEVKVQEERESTKILSQEEVEKNYIDASTYFDDGKYEDSLVLLEMVYNSKTESHLKDDVAFLLASTYERLNRNNEAIKTYEEYISLDDEENYIEEAYYKLAMLNMDINIDKAKEYAQKIAYNYSDSIYNNDNIKAIVES